MLDEKAVVSLPGDVVFRPLSAGGGVLLHMDSGSYHQVNGTGAELCARLAEGPASVASLTAELAAKYPGTAGLDADVADFVTDMQTRSLVAVDEP
jgi:hypothetical protein